MMEFIFDRTSDDVALVDDLNEKYQNGTITEAEKLLWAQDLKGALNASDLNRIEGNCATLAYLTGASVITKEWTGNDIPRISDFQRIRDNVQAIRDAWYTQSGIPETPQLPLTMYDKINDIERILHNVFTTYSLATDYCGEFYAGEEVAYL